MKPPKIVVRALLVEVDGKLTTIKLGEEVDESNIDYDGFGGAVFDCYGPMNPLIARLPTHPSSWPVIDGPLVWALREDVENRMTDMVGYVGQVDEDPCGSHAAVAVYRRYSGEWMVSAHERAFLAADEQLMSKEFSDDRRDANHRCDFDKKYPNARTARVAARRFVEAHLKKKCQSCWPKAVSRLTQKQELPAQPSHEQEAQ